MSDTNAQLSVARVEEARAEARLNEAGRTQSNPASEAASSEVLHSPLIGGLRQDEARLLREKADLQVTLGPQHPQIKKIKASLQTIQATIREEIGKIVDNLKSELELARARRVELERTVATLQLNGVSVADKEVRLRELEREASASRSLYTTLLTRALETRAQQTLQLADAEVASPANVPLEPSFPRARQLLPAAGGVGFLLGAVIVWLMERMRTGIAGEEEAHQISGIPVIMTMPKARARQAGRGLISNLAFRLNDSMRPLEVAVGQNGPGKLVLVASALPKEGRSTTASALALRIARSGRSCLLVDCDLRGSIVDRRGGAKAKAGLMQLLAGERSLPEVIYADDEPGLDVLPSGVTRLTAADRARSVRPEDRLAAILSSEAMSILLRGLAARYDMVVIDSPPIIGSPDALILSTHVDQTVLVVRWAATSRRAIVSTVQELQAAGARLPGIVLTHAPSKQGRAALHGVEPAAAAGYFGYH
jgi:capsular exopolysaccharide synthesis family protein